MASRGSPAAEITASTSASPAAIVSSSEGRFGHVSHGSWLRLSSIDFMRTKMKKRHEAASVGCQDAHHVLGDGRAQQSSPER